MLDYETATLLTGAVWGLAGVVWFLFPSTTIRKLHYAAGSDDSSVAPVAVEFARAFGLSLVLGGAFEIALAAHGSDDRNLFLWVALSRLFYSMLLSLGWIVIHYQDFFKRLGFYGALASCSLPVITILFAGDL